MPAPAVMTYTTLTTDIRTYSERPDDESLLAQIPQLILLTETEAAADLRILGTELVVASTLSPGAPTVAKPAFWRTTRSFTVQLPGGRRTLHKRVLEYVDNFWPDRTETDPPRFYAEYNAANFLVAPTPDAAYPFELVYTARLDPLSSSNEVNWLTANAPQIMLYGAMYHTSLFLKNFAKATMWRDRYDNAVAALTLENAVRKQDRSTEERQA